MNKSERQRSNVRSCPSLQQILQETRKRGEFQVSILTSTEGLPIAAVPQEYDSDLASAMIAVLQKASNEVQGNLGISEVDEVAIRGQDHTHLVCRRFAVKRDELILVAIVPSGHPYRQVMNRAIRRIREILA